MTINNMTVPELIERRAYLNNVLDELEAQCERSHRLALDNPKWRAAMTEVRDVANALLEFRKGK